VDSPQPIDIRPLQQGDIPALCALETRIFHRGWSEDAYHSELNNPSSAWLVIVDNGVLVGFGGLMRIVDEAHVTTIAVAESHRGMGLGKRLLVHLLDDARQRGVVRATLEVAAGNTVAKAMYKRFGFEHAAIRRNYYPDTGEDADILWIHAMDDPKWISRLEILRSEGENWSSKHRKPVGDRIGADPSQMPG